ncbi:bifunctional ADP-dependent NAD(P)H-hydrate dehydratase/NAD(P)H-hydrate epimerase [Paenibacillus sabinae]|uniref:Multifunctional fusion protein n=1 Tax=Paenibacillus sabinae T27 TaxID=1268072 RepID=X4Z696_9BACL|nr:bifunctional ADP-dependent NAD(P)H-hydrate dehydratase/NAD(P)H-hydrate epimerase [Paenibacillus sabinae]AHV95286.1 carbohydrate kinase [Paenibacillus sabinae T27]
MHLVTAEEMRRVDRITIDRIGIPAVALMENAGRAIAEEIIAFCNRRGKAGSAGAPRQGGGAAQGSSAPLDAGAWAAGSAHGEPAARSGARGVAFAAGATPRSGGPGGGPASPPKLAISGDAALMADHAESEHWLVLVGKGNNGGDGLVAARHLREAGIAVSLLYAVPPESLTGEAALQQGAAAAMGLPAAVHGGGCPDFAGYSGILDALLGTGAAGAPRGAYAELIAAANASGKPIVSADIPSGLNADTGETHEPCIQASLTVCLAFLKRGLLQYPGAGAAGSVVVRSIGIPAGLAREEGLSAYWLTPAVLEGVLGVDVRRRRAPDGHKGTYGHVLVAAGSLRMSGAGLLAARASLRAGCGLATWAVPGKLLPLLVGAAPELMLADAGGEADGTWNAAAAEEVLKLAKQRDVLAIGPGIGRFDDDKAWLKAIWEGSDCPLVVDADALNILAESDYGSWRQRRAPVILTPHPGEMARLAGVQTKEVQRDRIGLALSFARERGVTLVLKGAHTVIASPDGRVFVNTTGHPGMATGGAGDCLTGIIAGLLAQGLDGAQAAAFGVYLHGLAGEKAALLRDDPASVIASDIIEAL